MLFLSSLLYPTQQKIPGSVKKWKVPGILYNYGKKIKKNGLQRSANDHGEFQTQSPQRLVNIYEHMNSRDDQ